jgi:DNA-directed RNA polymerase specialized sigma subunit
MDTATAPSEDLAECSDHELLVLARSLPLDSRRRAAACEVLVTRYQSLVRSCARRYWGSPESADELMQVGYVGLMKAINRFDPEVGTSLAPYEHTLELEALSAHWSELPARQQRILLMRFYGNMTQSEIGDRLGLSQMHVSRLLARSLGYLRERLLGAEPEPETIGEA